MTETSAPPARIAGRSALQLGGMLGAGLIEAEELAERSLAVIRACDDPAIFTCLTPERAAAEAREAGARLRAGRPRGLLDGVPIAWKDLFDLAGLPTTAGSAVLRGAPPAMRDAGVVERLRQAGMVCLGRVNMSEFAFSGIGANPHYGTPRNPCGAGVARMPGGSSSGSAVAVARGLAPVSIGSDTGGSVRIPAAFNGIVGYKSSSGRYPMDGVFPLSRTLDTLGVLSRSVADAVIVDAAMRGCAGQGLRRAPLQGRRVVVPTNIVFDEAQHDVVANFNAALGRLAAAGMQVERRALPVFDEILALGRQRGTIVTAEAFALHRERLDGPEAARIDRRVVTRVRMGGGIAMADYAIVLQERRRLIAATAEWLGDGTLVAYPTVPHVAPPLDALEADDELFLRVNMLTLRNTMLGNFLDWCGVSVPTGTGEDGLPTALLLSGAPGTDDALLALALDAEPVIRGEPL